MEFTNSKVSQKWKYTIISPENDSAPHKAIIEPRVSVDGISKSFSFPLHIVNGICYPPFCSSKRWNEIDSRISYREDDIILVSYPKCGTTWVEQCALLLLHSEVVLLIPIVLSIRFNIRVLGNGSKE